MGWLERTAGKFLMSPDEVFISFEEMCTSCFDDNDNDPMMSEVLTITSLP